MRDAVNTHNSESSKRVGKSNLRLKNVTDEPICKAYLRNRDTDIENKRVDTTQERGVGIDWEVGIDIIHGSSSGVSCSVMSDSLRPDKL